MAFFRRNDEFRSGSDDRFDRAMAAGRAGNGIEEQRLYAELADEGNQHAMHNLGVILRDAGDTQQAVAWFTRAAEAGATQSLKALAGHYHDLREREAALRWAHAYVERAKVGTAMGEKADAMKDLGILLNDYGMTAEALEWSRKAGESGSRDGLFNTGVLLAGQGDSVEAAQWFLRAAAAGHPSGLAAAAEVQATASPARSSPRAWCTRLIPRLGVSSGCEGLEF